MKNVYDVRYEIRYNGEREWLSGSKRVLANGDAQDAVDMCRSAVLKEKVEVTRKGKPVNQPVAAFRFTGAEIVTHIDIF